MKTKLFIIFFFVFTLNVFAEIELNAPDKIAAGAKISVSINGEGAERDFVTIVTSDTPEKKYSDYKYRRKHSQLEFTAPEDPGSYEIRYLEEKTYKTIAKIPLQIEEVSASLEAPTEVSAGSTVEINWQGPDNQRDFITIVDKDEKPGKYNQYKYTKNKPTRGVRPIKGAGMVELHAPETAGEYEIRYLSGKRYYTLASSALTVTAVSASINAPEETAAGANLTVNWTGPNNDKDFVTIVEKEAKEGAYKQYKYAAKSKNNQAEFTAPDEPGEYEVRYLTGKDRLTLARASLNVKSVTASVEAPLEIMAGSEFAIKWQGPNNKKDFITIVEKDAKPGSYKSYVYTSKKRRLDEPQNQVELTAPETPGEYEVRYLTGGKHYTLASQVVTIKPVTASVMAPEEAVVSEAVEVSWEGPNNNGDFVTIVAVDSDKDYSKHYAYTKRGKILKIRTPNSPGDYEVRYLTAKQKIVLARKAIKLVPSKVPGTLQVISDPKSEFAKNKSGMSVELILDASGSMLKQENGTRRIETAKKAIHNLVEKVLLEKAPFALRVFGHKEAGSCRTDLEVPLGPLSKSNIKNKIAGINAKNLAKTPIAKSLQMVKSDLASAENKRVVILVTDGEETCDGDPKAAIEELVAAGFDTRINIVGFAIDEFMLKETFREWARVGNGKYFDAQNAEELEESIQEAIEVPYQVLGPEGKIINSGVVNGAPISVLPGQYSVKVLDDSEQIISDIKVESKKDKVVKVS